MTDSPPALSRADQQAQRLRDNLRRRNAQRRARKADADSGVDAAPAASSALNPAAGLDAAPDDR